MPTIRTFFDDRSGSIMPLFAVMLVTMFGMIGAAVDFARWHNAKKHVSDLTDRALVAAGRQLQTVPSEPENALAAAQIYFDEQIKRGLTVITPAARFKLTDGNMGIEARVTGTIKTPFLKFVSVPSLPIDTTSRVQFSTGSTGGTGVELSMMLDVTGSMCNDGEGPCTSSTKLDALKQAAKNLVDILIHDNQDAKIAIVPFSTRVRLGQHTDFAAIDLASKVTGLPTNWTGWWAYCAAGSGSGGSETSGNWACNSVAVEKVENWPLIPCITDRNGSEADTDAAPGPNTWSNAHGGDRFPLSRNSGNTPFTSATGLSEKDPSSNWNYMDYNCADIGAGNSIIPLSKDADTLKSAIDGLEAYGSTAGALGTAWAWYVLSPNWNKIWSGDSAPASYGLIDSRGPTGAPRLRKIAVLMTDGDYNTYTSNKNTDPATVTAHAKALCENMKAKGVEVFTVGFKLNELPGVERSRAIETLEACGSDVGHFYNSIDENHLLNAFRDIALKISVLYIAQ